MDKVFEKTRELAEALMESEAYQIMKDAETKAMGNAEAASLMSDFLEARTKLHELMQSENPDPGAMKRVSDEMDEAQERMQMIDDVVALNQARQSFNGLMDQVAQVLQFMITGRMDDPSGCSGDCSGCAGCH